DFIDTLAPYSEAAEWDNSGLNIGSRDHEVRKVLLSLDVTDDVAEEAARKRCGLIVSHHPVIFSPLKNIDEHSVVYSLIRFNIAALSAHTNFDRVPGGVCDILAYLAGVDAMSDLAPENPEVIGRIGMAPQSTLYAFTARLKTTLAAPCVQYFDAHRPVLKVAVVSGAGGSEVEAAVKAGADTLLTGEVSYHHWLEAQHYGINLVAAGHFETEVPAMHYLKTTLEHKFPDVAFELSETCRGVIELA
ncbi:MAG: Nif3-like dinuclear metal center hexameric protein, partial [Eubacteriales bacterium]